MAKELVVVKQPGQAPERQYIEITGDNLREIVGGWLEAVEPGEPGSAGLTLWLDEEGKLKPDKLANVTWAPGRDILVGPVVATSTDRKGNSIGLTEKQAQWIERWMMDNAVF